MIDDMCAGEYTPYFAWLIDRVGGDDWWEEYIPSLVRLFSRKYYYVNPIDSGTYEGGIDIRTEAMVDGVDILSIPNGEPSILEVLVALCEKIDDSIMFSEDVGSRTPRWFDDIMTVLNFKKQDGNIDRQIDRFLEGKAQICKRMGFGAHEKTLWEQVNLFYSKQFDLETDLI